VSRVSSASVSTGKLLQDDPSQYLSRGTFAFIDRSSSAEKLLNESVAQSTP
jgi:hypothetical protein